MKKRNLKNLKLNKNSISNLTDKEKNTIGGYPVSTASRCPWCPSYDPEAYTCDLICW